MFFCFFLLSFFEELQARRKFSHWIFWVTYHTWLPLSMLVPIDIWGSIAQFKTAMTEWHILIHHLGNVKKAAVCGADSQRTSVFKERITFRQPCLLFLEGVAQECSYKNMLGGAGDSYSCSFLSILHPFLGIFLHSHLCNAFLQLELPSVYLKKKPTNQHQKWWPQTNICCIWRYWTCKTSILSESRTQETWCKCANWLACAQANRLDLVC